MKKIDLAQSYVGTPYNEKDMDCAHFFIKAQKEIYGKEVNLSTKYDNHKGGRRVQKSKIDRAICEVTEQIESPVDGCGVLMTNLDGTYHIGIAVEHRKEFYILHNSYLMGGVCLVKLRDLMLRIEGFYAVK